LQDWIVYLMRLIDLANVPNDCDGLMNLIVREQYFEGATENAGLENEGPSKRRGR